MKRGMVGRRGARDGTALPEPLRRVVLPVLASLLALPLVACDASPFGPSDRDLAITSNIDAVRGDTGGGAGGPPGDSALEEGQ
jgi:hypothetical protein